MYIPDSSKYPVELPKELPTLQPDRELQVALAFVAQKVLEDERLGDVASARRGLIRWAKSMNIPPNEALAVLGKALDVHLRLLLAPVTEKELKS